MTASKPRTGAKPDPSLRGMPLLDAVITYLEAHPAAWADPGSGGLEDWIATLAGGESHLDGCLTAEPDDDPADIDGPCVIAFDRSRRLLGISQEDAKDLFEGTGYDLARIKAVRDRLAAREGAS